MKKIRAKIDLMAPMLMEGRPPCRPKNERWVLHPSFARHGTGASRLLVPKLQLGNAFVWEALLPPQFATQRATKLELRKQWHSQARAWERGKATQSGSLQTAAP